VKEYRDSHKARRLDYGRLKRSTGRPRAVMKPGGPE
jgi:hypothetical protein